MAGASCGDDGDDRDAADEHVTAGDAGAGFRFRGHGLWYPFRLRRLSPKSIALSRSDASSLSPNAGCGNGRLTCQELWVTTDRKSTRLNSSHEWISYAVFCLKKKK